MHEFFKIFVLSTIAITLWTAFTLLQDKRGHKLLNRWFAAFLVALTFPQMDLYVNQVVPGGVFKLAVVASTFLWLKGPFIWTFTKVLTRKDASFSVIWIHFLPWVCVLSALLAFPQFFMTCVFLGMCHMLGYLLFSLKHLIKMRTYLADIWYGFQNSAYYWLLYVIFGAMILVIVDFVAISLVTSGVVHSYELLDYFAFPLFSIYVLSVGILSVYRPEMLFREVTEATPRLSSISAVVEEKPVIQDQKERYLELDLVLAQSLTQELTQLMEEEHVYRQNELSLPDLAKSLGISVHQVSELLNVHSGISFYDYINGYRLKYACVLLADPKCHLRILDIAFEAGYNSKNSFYRIFKEGLGVTPNQFRVNALAAQSADSAVVTKI